MADKPEVEPVCESPAAGVRNNVALHLLLLMGFALVLNREATGVPGGNENIYFLYLYKAWHHPFLAGDWTITGEPTAGHAVFNVLFGWPTLLMPFQWLKWYGWLGRVVSWAVLFAALLRMGRHFALPLWVSSAAILLWLIQRQSFVGNEWIIGTFEAKCVGYACLLWAINLALDGGLILPAVLTGLSFSFHSAVGLWGGAAVFVAFAMQNPARRSAVFAAVAALCGLPGLLTSLHLQVTGENARFLVTREMPFHLDPTVFGGGKIAVLYLMLLFNWLHYRANRGNRKLQFFAWFQLAGGSFFALGVLWRRLGMFEWEELFPFRVFAVTTMLMFFWNLAAAYRQSLTVNRAGRPIGALAAGLGIVTFLALPSPVMRLQTLAAYDLPRWREQPDDLQQCFTWVRDHIPVNQVVIAPPWRKDVYYFTEHPLIGCWHAPRYNDMTNWRQRMYALCGQENLDHLDVAENLAGEMDDAAQQYYFHLSPAQLGDIRHRFGGEVLITSGQYNYHEIFATADGNYRVYRLRD
jgi:hypothetical protein